MRNLFVQVTYFKTLLCFFLESQTSSEINGALFFLESAYHSLFYLNKGYPTQIGYTINHHRVIPKNRYQLIALQLLIAAAANFSNFCEL